MNSVPLGGSPKFCTVFVPVNNNIVAAVLVANPGLEVKSSIVFYIREFANSTLGRKVSYLDVLVIFLSFSR
jgi:hypothetical protein